MSPVKIVKTIFLKAPPSHVWKFLTKAELLANWFHLCDADMQEGADYNFLTNSHDKPGEKLMQGRVLTMQEPKLLVYTFTHQMLQGVETTCTWTLDPADGGTILTLVHDGWDNVEVDPFDIAAKHDVGWDEHFVRLRRVTY